MDTAAKRSATARPSFVNAAKVAVIYHGDAERRRQATPETSKVPSIFPALASVGLTGVPVVYHDDFRDDVRQQLLGMQAALVWVNPIEQGCDQTHLDQLLRDAAAAGLYVSTHPDTILKLGTKQVLVDTREMSWSAPGPPGTIAHRTPEELRAALRAHWPNGKGAPRVLKQYRGHGGIGVWKVEPAKHVAGQPGLASEPQLPQLPQLRVREAPSGSAEQVLTIDAFVKRCAAYFTGDGRMVDQPYQSRLPEGMTRCYLVHDKVEGFGHQAVNVLCPASADAPRDAFPPTSARLYSPPDNPAFQALKRELEGVWLPQLKDLFHLSAADLPALWDCDFLLGEKTAEGTDRYVLCEINVSCVSPFPESVLKPLALAVRVRIDERG